MPWLLRSGQKVTLPIAPAVGVTGRDLYILPILTDDDAEMAKKSGRVADASFDTHFPPVLPKRGGHVEYDRRYPCGIPGGEIVHDGNRCTHAVAMSRAFDLDVWMPQRDLSSSNSDNVCPAVGPTTNRSTDQPINNYWQAITAVLFTQSSGGSVPRNNVVEGNFSR